jgi:hypothetical protein
MSDLDVHRATSKTIIDGAIAALNAEAAATGGHADFPPLGLTNSAETVLPDFERFADAATAFAARNPQIAPEHFADVAILGMITASPDCHTYYLDRGGTRHDSRIVAAPGTAAQPPAGGTVLASGDEIGLQAKLLEGGAVYITFREFPTSATYSLPNEMKRILDRGLASGATSWIFDLRGNSGGEPPLVLTSWFLNGEPTLVIRFRSGTPDTQSAVKELRLPDAYQLPIAVILNARGGSSPEVFAASLRENGRATIVGAKSTGCLGAVAQTRMPDGSQISVAIQEFVGAVTGTHYNNVGIQPDIAATDGQAVARAIEAVAKARK